MIEIVMYGLVFAVVGAALCFVDEKHGVKLYVPVWNFFHKESITKEEGRSFICGQSTGKRVLPALVVTLASCFVLRYLGEHDLIMLALKGTFLMFPGLLTGFALMGFLRRNKSVVASTERAFAVLDRMERSEVDITQVASGLAGKATEAGKKVVQVAKDLGDKVQPTPVVKAAPPVDTAAPVTPSDATPQRQGLDEALRKFNRRS